MPCKSEKKNYDYKSEEKNIVKRFGKNLATLLVCALAFGSISLPVSATEADTEVKTGWQHEV